MLVLTWELVFSLFATKLIPNLFRVPSGCHGSETANGQYAEPGRQGVGTWKLSSKLSCPRMEAKGVSRVGSRTSLRNWNPDVLSSQGFRVKKDRNTHVGLNTGMRC